MSRYIDKDKVLKIVNDMTECEDDYKRITNWVYNMPTIDIVRCKECKYDGTWKCRWRNTQIPSYPSADDYCSYGEREGK